MGMTPLFTHADLEQAWDAGFSIGFERGKSEEANRHDTAYARRENRRVYVEDATAKADKGKGK